jgi:hypothetical protein
VRSVLKSNPAARFLISLVVLLLLGLTDGAGAPVLGQQMGSPPPDPGDPGPFQPITQREYNFGDTAYEPPKQFFLYPVEFRARASEGISRRGHETNIRASHG